MSSARWAVITGGVRLRPESVRIMFFVNWLLTPSAFVATAVNVLFPTTSGTSKKANRPLGSDVVRLAPVWLEGHAHVGIGLADQRHQAVGRLAVADRRRGS